MRILLIRHGETTANCDKRFQGHKDYPLTDWGEHQAKALAHELSKVNVQAVYTSGLSRAKLTADPISANHNITPVIDQDLLEYSWGIIEGLTREEIRVYYPELSEKLERDFFNTNIPGEEGLHGFLNRIQKVYTKYIEFHAKSSTMDEAIVIVSHGKLLNGLLVYLTGYDFFDTPWPFTFANASITEVTLLDKYRKGKVITLNDTCHLC